MRARVSLTTSSMSSSRSGGVTFSGSGRGTIRADSSSLMSLSRSERSSARGGSGAPSPVGGMASSSTGGYEGSTSSTGGSEGSLSSRGGSEGSLSSRGGSEGSLSSKGGSDGSDSSNGGSEGSDSSNGGSEGSDLSTCRCEGGASSIGTGGGAGPFHRDESGV